MIWIIVALLVVLELLYFQIANHFNIIDIHFAAMLLLFQEFGILNLESWWMILLGLIFCVGIINAYNFMDGINGITGGYSLAVLLPLYYLNRELDFVDPNFLLVVLFSVLVFNFYNFRTRARCFAGDVGSVGIAFIILFALGRLILQTGDFSYLLFLMVYGVDSVLTIVHRLLLHENIGEAHRKHVYQLMANELRIPHVVVSSVYMGTQLLLSFGLILLPFNHWTYFGIVLVILTVIYVWFKKKYYHLHAEYLMRLNQK